jgi:hypothetical protein
LKTLEKKGTPGGLRETKPSVPAKRDSATKDVAGIMLTTPGKMRKPFQAR